MRALTAATLLAGALAACGNDAPRGSDAEGGGVGGTPSPFTASPFPAASCVDSVAYEAELWEVASVVPPEVQRRSGPKPQDAGWLPTRLADLAVVEDGFAVVDAPVAEVTRFSRDFTEREQWGRKGSGPGEFAQPVAVAAGPGGQIWVLDQSRVSVFDHDGGFVRSFALRGSGIDLAVDEGGRAYVAHIVVPDMVRRGDERFGTLLTGYDPDGTDAREMLTVSPEDLAPPRFVLPGPGHARVIARGGRIAVIHPAAGVVDVFQDGARIATVAACMPDALADAYERQRRAGGNRQRYVDLVTDVFLGDDGVIHLVGPLMDQEGRYHIARFSATGEPLGSVVMPGTRIRLPNETRFGASPAELVGFDARGVVVRFEVRSGGADRAPPTG